MGKASIDRRHWQEVWIKRANFGEAVYGHLGEIEGYAAGALQALARTPLILLVEHECHTGGCYNHMAIVDWDDVPLSESWVMVSPLS